MTHLPNGWNTERAPGWWDIHYLTHHCGWRSNTPYDLAADQHRINWIIQTHRCNSRTPT